MLIPNLPFHKSYGSPQIKEYARSTLKMSIIRVTINKNI